MSLHIQKVLGLAGSLTLAKAAETESKVEPADKATLIHDPSFASIFAQSGEA
jgi:hypothetical protein